MITSQLSHRIASFRYVYDMLATRRVRFGLVSTFNNTSWFVVIVLETFVVLLLIRLNAITYTTQASWLAEAPAGDLRLPGYVTNPTGPASVWRDQAIKAEAPYRSVDDNEQATETAETKTLSLKKWQRAIWMAYEAEREPREKLYSVFAGSAEATPEDEEYGVGGLSDWVGDANKRAARTAIVTDEQREWLFMGRRHPYRGGWNGGLDPAVWGHDAYDAAVAHAAEERREQRQRKKLGDSRNKASAAHREREAAQSKAQDNFLESLNDGWDTATIDSSELLEDGDDADGDASDPEQAESSSKRDGTSSQRIGIGMKGTRFFQLSLDAKVEDVRDTANRLKNAARARARAASRSSSSSRSSASSRSSGGDSASTSLSPLPPLPSGEGEVGATPDAESMMTTAPRSTELANEKIENPEYQPGEGELGLRRGKLVSAKKGIGVGVNVGSIRWNRGAVLAERDKDQLDALVRMAWKNAAEGGSSLGKSS